MAFDVKEMLDRARGHLAQRLGVSEQDIHEESIEPTDFPDAALGAAAEGEMSAQVITPGWRIRVKANGQTYEYRASARQLRLLNFHGENFRID
ncbi:MAG: hypothetical protein QOE96_1234 [Blastocatellia bacterium]|jgi:hypothetical protein|nr:hypothetical protein [Blastocatellia bacterium]